jgi:hypothetical protein
MRELVHDPMNTRSTAMSVILSPPFSPIYSSESFHRKGADRLTGIFQGVTDAARGADLANDGKRQILCGDVRREPAVNNHAHALRFGLDQGLRRKHMLGLRRTDAEGERTECAMSGSMAVTAHKRQSRQREALLGAHDVANALALVEFVIIFEPEEFGVFREVGHLRGTLRIRIGIPPVGSWHVVVDDQ